MTQNKSSFKKVLLMLALVLLVSLTGCAAEQSASPTVPETTESVTPTPSLNLTVHTDPESWISLSSEETGGNYSEGVQYRNFDSVTIELDGTAIPFEQALRENLITEEEVFCYARMDARNGFCEQSTESNHGLTHFTFSYPEFNLRLIYDIYETPDGQQHLISDLCIYQRSDTYILDPYVDFYDSETGERLDQEDWGIELEVNEVSPTGITLTCTQSGGQQIGQLYIDAYTLSNDDGAVSRLDNSAEAPSYTLDLQMEGTTQIAIDWTDVYGELPSGDYLISLWIYDRFTKSQVHPLMDDFHDWWLYSVTFTIP